jgi:hypothetical protein
MGDHLTGNQARYLSIERDSALMIEFRSGRERQQDVASHGQEPDSRRAASRKEPPIDVPMRS